jgi:hypothetical protein
MLGTFKQLPHRGFFHDASGIHYGHFLAHFSHNPQVMGNQQNGGLVFFADFP